MKITNPARKDPFRVRRNKDDRGGPKPAQASNKPAQATRPATTTWRCCEVLAREINPFGKTKRGAA